MFARDLLIAHMASLPDGPFTNKAACLPYAEEELSCVHTDVQSKQSAEFTADTSEYLTK
jgi:hypothetical protein